MTHDRRLPYHLVRILFRSCLLHRLAIKVLEHAIGGNHRFSIPRGTDCRDLPKAVFTTNLRIVLFIPTAKGYPPYDT